MICLFPYIVQGFRIDTLIIKLEKNLWSYSIYYFAYFIKLIVVAAQATSGSVIKND